MCVQGTPQFNEAVGRWKHGDEMMPGKALLLLPASRTDAADGCLSCAQCLQFTLCWDLCVCKLAISCHLRLFHKEREHPKLRPRRALSRWVRSLNSCLTRVRSGPSTGHHRPLLGRAASSITNFILALPSADRSQYCNAEHPWPLGSQAQAPPQVTKQRLWVILDST